MSTQVLAGRRVIVTGGAIRLGRAIALELARQGAAVCVHYHHSQAAAEDVVRQIELSGGRGVAIPADLDQPADVADALFARAAEALGEINTLVNSAAIFEPDSLATVTQSNFERHLRINLLAPLLLSQAFTRQLAEDSRGHIINIADWRALRPKPGHLAYTMSKAGLVALTKMLALELAPRIQVNAIAPGAILPPSGAEEAYTRQLVDRIPLGRLGGPGEIARAVCFLLQSDFVAGEVIAMTGGEQL